MGKQTLNATCSSLFKFVQVGFQVGLEFDNILVESKSLCVTACNYTSKEEELFNYHGVCTTVQDLH